MARIASLIGWSAYGGNSLALSDYQTVDNLSLVEMMGIEPMSKIILLK